MKKIKENYSVYLMLFIILQPILDLLTFLSMNLSNSSITPGIVIRMLVLGFSMLYLYSRRNSYLDKKTFYYILIYAIYLVIHFVVNLIQKDSFNLISEVTAIAKNSYFLLFFLIFVVSFKEIRDKNLKMSFPINISFSMLIINSVMLLATLTGTGKRSYGALYKIGHSGWFYAANDTGVILALALPILIWIAFKSHSTKMLVFNWINIILIMLSLFTVGTKVGHLAVVISLIIASISFVFEITVNKRKSKTNTISLIISASLATATLVLTPYLPAYTNSTGQIAALMNQATESENLGSALDDPSDEPISQEDDFFGERSTNQPEIIDGVIYSGRTDFMALHQDYFNKAPLTQKVFGMGYAGNYEGSPKIIERDFHDIFYEFGLFGFALYMLPFVYYGLLVFIQLLKNLKDSLSIKKTMLFSSIALGLGIGYLAGHTLTSPAVSIYLAIVLGYIVVESEYEKVGLL